MLTDCEIVLAHALEDIRAYADLWLGCLALPVRPLDQKIDFLLHELWVFRVEHVPKVLSRRSVPLVVVLVIREVLIEVFDLDASRLVLFPETDVLELGDHYLLQFLHANQLYGQSVAYVLLSHEDVSHELDWAG